MAEINADFIGSLHFNEVNIVPLNKCNPSVAFEAAREGKLLFEEKKGIFDNFKINALNRKEDYKIFEELKEDYIDNYIKEGVK